jgi:hypothetical protein
MSRAALERRFIRRRQPSEPVRGGRLRGALVAGVVGSGVALAVSLLPAIHAWRP